MTEFAELVECYLRRESRSPSWLAKQLSVYPSTPGRWLNEGSRPSTPEMVLQIADALNIDDKNERHALLVAAGYGIRDRKILDGHSSTTAEAGVGQTFNETSASDIVLAKLERFFRWNEAPTHWRISRAGMVMYTLGQVATYITPQRTVVMLVWVFIWIIAVQLAGPVHRWPMNDASQRWLSCLRFGAAGFLIPLLIGTITVPDAWSSYKPERLRTRLGVFTLKFTGALVGFYVFSMLTVVASLWWSFITETPLTQRSVILLLWIPLLASYMGAKRIPYDRFRSGGSEPDIIATDLLFLSVFVLAVPATSLFIYVNHLLLVDRFLGPLVFICALGIVALLAQKRRRTIPDTDS